MKLTVNIAKAKGMFFDSAKVLAAVDKATRTVLSRFGAYVRTAARSSIRTRKKPSSPGQPPSSHTGLLKNFIFFGYDTATRSVVIGPVRLSQKSGDALPALEFGGPSMAVSLDRHNRIKERRIIVKARPFMGPAFEREKAKLPPMWANSIR